MSRRIFFLISTTFHLCDDRTVTTAHCWSPPAPEKDWSSFSVVDKWSQCVTKKKKLPTLCFCSFILKRLLGPEGSDCEILFIILWLVCMCVCVCVYVSKRRKRDINHSVHQSEWTKEWLAERPESPLWENCYHDKLSMQIYVFKWYVLVVSLLFMCKLKVYTVSVCKRFPVVQSLTLTDTDSELLLTGCCAVCV